MSRITITDLRDTVETINGYLADDGALVRFEVSPRNGYQAVDEYNVHPDGSRNGSGVSRMIGGGTSREVIGYCWEEFAKLQRR